MKKVVDRNFLVPFLLVASLFFLWGFAHSILDVLNKHFQDVLVISKSRSALVQAMVYSGYFVMALPAGVVIRKWGYKAGVLCGLALYGLGALLFIPGGRMMNFSFFLFCLFVIGCGLTFLETSANPYVTVLGAPETSASRLNLAQSLNGLGWIAGPLVGSLVVLSDADGNGGGNLSAPYAVIGVMVLLIAVVFSRVKLPEIQESYEGAADAKDQKLWSQWKFTFGVVALFFYVAAQTGINSFFINYTIETLPQVSARIAGLILSFGGMGLFMFGRVTGSQVMKHIRAEKLLTVLALIASLCMLAVIFGKGYFSMSAILLCYLCESIMFPTIFALAIKGLNPENTKKGSSYLIMTIVGGAVAPVLMGLIGETQMAMGFFVPLICFFVILAYGLRYSKSE